MKKYNIIIAILLVLLISACSKSWLDVNTDPDNPSSASPELVLPSATVSVGTVIGGYYNLLGGFWSQYWTQSAGSNQYKNIDSYQLLNSDFDDQWSEMYTGAFKNLKYVKETSAKNKNWNYVFISTVIESYAYQVMADLYNQIPFNEAIQGVSQNNTHPHFDDAMTVYDSITDRLKKLSSLDLSTKLSAEQASKDLVFGGDMDQWKAFANTLLLKIYIRQMYVRPDVAKAGINELYANGATFLSRDAKLDIFTNDPNKDNPLYESDRRGLNTTTNLRASATLFKYLYTSGDPRIDRIYGLGPDNTTNPPLALPQGAVSVPELGTPAAIAATSVVILLPTDAVYFISAAESNFLQAEAIAKGWGIGNDLNLYELGVKASFAKFGLDTATARSFLNSLYMYPVGGSFEEKQQAIIMQKWISMARSEGLEAFFETNRTHYPKISETTYNSPDYQNYTGGELMYSLIGVTNGQFPKRLLFPDFERTRNPNTPTEVPLTQKVWWDVKN